MIWKIAKSSWFSVLWIVLLNVMARAAWLLYMHPVQQADFAWYFTHASAMTHGQGYTWGGQYTAYWPIGWPFCLSLLFRFTGTKVMAGLILNAIFSIGIVLCVYYFAKTIFRSQTVAVCAAIGYTLLPSQIEWNAVLGSEESFTFLLMLSLCLYLKSRKSRQMRSTPSLLPVCISGLIMGLACDVRPIPLLFPIVLFAYELLTTRSKWRVSLLRTLTFVVSMLLTILPVTVRNAITMHHFVLVSTNGGTDLWQGTMTDNGYFWSWDPHMNPLLAAKNNEILKEQIGERVAIQHILAHPIWTLHHGWLKIIALYQNDTNAVWYTFHATKGLTDLVAPFDTFDNICYYIFMAIMLIGIIALYNVNSEALQAAMLPLSFAVYYTLTFLVFPAWDRFRYPLMPIFAVFLGYAVFILIQVIMNKQAKVPQPPQSSAHQMQNPTT